MLEDKVLSLMSYNAGPYMKFKHLTMAPCHWYRKHLTTIFMKCGNFLPAFSQIHPISRRHKT